MSQITALIEEMQRQIMNLEKRIGEIESAEYSRFNYIYLVDDTDEPTTVSGWGIFFIDAADGDLKIKFGDGTVTTIAVDT